MCAIGLTAHGLSGRTIFCSTEDLDRAASWAGGSRPHTRSALARTGSIEITAIGRTTYCDARRHLRTLPHDRRGRSPAQVPISGGCHRRTRRVRFITRRPRRGPVEAASGDQAPCRRRSRWPARTARSRRRRTPVRAIRAIEDEPLIDRSGAPVFARRAGGFTD
jgi:hypothetical protein